MSKTQILASKYRHTFSTPQGEDVLADLRAEFYDGSLLGPDAHKMAVLVGGRTVVRYILDMLEDTDET
jgi:hypothetical protein